MKICEYMSTCPIYKQPICFVMIDRLVKECYYFGILNGRKPIILIWFIKHWSDTKMLKVHILTDDRVRKRGMLAEHGLSLWIEKDGKAILRMMK